MSARLSRRFVLSLAGAACWPLAARAETLSVHRAAIAFGSTSRLTLVGVQGAEGEAALDHCFQIIRSVERAASLFRADSALSQLNAAGALKNPPPELVEILSRCATLSARTQGAFDVTIQPLWRACDDAVKAGGWPDDVKIAALREKIDWRAVEVAPQNIAFAKPGMAITLNSIAKGYASEKISDFLTEIGVKNAFLDVGGLEARGKRGDGVGWTAGLAAPRAPDQIMGVIGPFTGCLSISGDYEYFWSADFSRNHIIDPATGLSPTELASTGVIAKRGGDSDALSTALMVLGADKGLELIETLDGVEGIAIAKDGSWRKTKNFPLQPA